MKELIVATAIGLILCLGTAALVVSQYSSLYEKCIGTSICPDVFDANGYYEERGWPVSFLVRSEGDKLGGPYAETEVNYGAFAISLGFWTVVSFGALTVFKRIKK